MEKPGCGEEEVVSLTRRGRVNLNTCMSVAVIGLSEALTVWNDTSHKQHQASAKQGSEVEINGIIADGIECVKAL